MTVKDLPTLNAMLNGISAVFLLIGFICIKRGNKSLHGKMMMSAFVTSILFLASYLYYHFNVHMVTKYHGGGILRPIYFFILFTHIPLAAIVAPAALVAIWFALKKQFERHKKVTVWLWPVWMYVSVTGVIIYLMLYVL